LKEDFEIPFGGSDEEEEGEEASANVFAELPDIAVTKKKAQAAPKQKTYMVKGKPNGATTAEFQKIISDFGNNLARAKPFKESEDPELDGLNVLACYGAYCGDLNCVKCPLRNYCLHA